MSSAANPRPDGADGTEEATGTNETGTNGAGTNETGTNGAGGTDAGTGTDESSVPGDPARPVPAAWATVRSRRRPVRDLARGTLADLRWLGRDLARARRRPEDEPVADGPASVTGAVEPVEPVEPVQPGRPVQSVEPGGPRLRTVGAAPAGWARTRPVRAVRGVLQTLALAPALRTELAIESFGAGTGEPGAGTADRLLLVANHASHLDALVIATSLPRGLRRRLAVAASADYFFDAWWRAVPSALLVNSLPLHDGTDAAAEVQRLLDGGWVVLVFGEPSRSDDGSVHPFDPQVAALAQQVDAPVVPVGVRGTFSAMPRGRFRVRTGRPRVSVRFGDPIRPEPAESAAAFAARLTEAVRDLIAEDTQTWWRVLTGDTDPGSQLEPGPTAARWRRIWARTDAMAKGGERSRPRIWP